MTLEKPEKVTPTWIAAALLKIEAKLAEARAEFLLNRHKEFLIALAEARVDMEVLDTSTGQRLTDDESTCSYAVATGLPVNPD